MGNLFFAEINEFDLPGSFKEVQSGDGDGEVETFWAGAAGVEVEDALFPVFMHPVGVSGDDHRDLGEFWVEIDVVQIEIGRAHV